MMTDKEQREKLNNFAAVMLGWGYIDDYIFGTTKNNRPKVEFTYNNLDCIVVYIPTKGFQCYVDNTDIGIFANYEKFKNYVDKEYK